LTSKQIIDENHSTQTQQIQLELIFYQLQQNKGKVFSHLQQYMVGYTKNSSPIMLTSNAIAPIKSLPFAVFTSWFSNGVLTAMNLTIKEHNHSSATRH
jgi:hypothetical protein